MRPTRYVLSLTLAAAASSAMGQATLTGTSYTTNFDAISGGLPDGFSVRSGATTSSSGSAILITSSTTAYSEEAAGFRNVASAGTPGIAANSTTATQNASTNRAVGLRQGDTFGDPGAAFSFRGQSGSGPLSFQSLTFDAQLLNVQPRDTVFTVRYGVGPSPTSFTSLGTISTGTGGNTNLNSVFGSQTASYSLTGQTALQNVAGEVTFQIVALAATGGTGDRDVFAIDNFALTFTPVPEPTTVLGLAALALGAGRAVRRKLLA